MPKYKVLRGVTWDDGRAEPGDTTDLRGLTARDVKRLIAKGAVEVKRAR